MSETQNHPKDGQTLASRVAERLVARARREEQERREHYRRGREVAERAAKLFASHDAARVILFGSLAEPGSYSTTRSDVDLAVEGIDPDELSSLLTELTMEFGIHIDVIDMEQIAEDFRKRILVEGEVLYVA